MTCEQFDPLCPGCRPVMFDPATGLALPSDHPIMQVVNRLWDALPRERQEACWRVWVKNSREPGDIAMITEFLEACQKAPMTSPTKRRTMRS